MNRAIGAMIVGWLVVGALLTLLTGCSTDTSDPEGAASEGTASDGQSSGTAGTVAGSFSHRTADVNGARLHYVI
jgi:hypothetical protein